MDMLRVKLGNRWAYRLRERILLTKPDVYPSPELVRQDLERIQTREVNIFNPTPSGETYLQESIAIS